MSQQLTREQWQDLQFALRGRTLRINEVRGADWSGLDLSGSDLSCARLTDVVLKGAKLTGANLIGAVLTDCDLTGADLSNAHLEEARLIRCGLEAANLSGVQQNEGTRWPDGFKPDAVKSGGRTEPPLDVRQYIECWDLSGECHRVMVRSPWLELVRRIWREGIHSVSRAALPASSVEHGSYEGLSRYQLKGLAYAGAAEGYPAYTEALQIKDPPDGRGRGVLYDYDGRRGSWFAEFDEPGQAKAAYNRWWRQTSADASAQKRMLAKLAGFRRFVWCGPLVPWFYAVGNEQLYTGGVYEQDVVLPDWLTDHPTYRLGSWWLLTDREGVSRPVQCLGASRFVQTNQPDSWRESKREVVWIYWSDGTRVEIGELARSAQAIQPEQSAWSAVAHQWLDELLAGRRDHVVLDTVGGQKVTMRVGRRARKASRAGQYQYEVTLDQDLPFEAPVFDEWGDDTGDRETKMGRTAAGSFAFSPTPDRHTPEEAFRQMLAKLHPGVAIVQLRLKLLSPEPGGLRWSGVYWGEEPLVRLDPPSR